MVETKITGLGELLAKNNYEIIEEKTAALTAPGEHYGSVMLTVDLKLKNIENDEEKSLQLVAKLPPSNAMLRVVFDVAVTFKKEVLAYTEAVPALEDFSKSYQSLFPKCYGAEFGDTSLLLFENLKLEGFYTEDRLKGFEAEAVEIVLENLAVFHATPLALKLLKPLVFDSKVRPCLVKNSGLEQLPEIGAVFHNSILEGAQDCQELAPYMDRIRKICDRKEIEKTPNEPWGTICHSDFWTSNTMVLKKNGKYVDSKILDLQLITYDSPVKDLIFFLYTSVVNTVLERHLDEFIRIYYENFIKVLKNCEIDLEPFSWEEFQKEIEEAGKKEIYHVLVMLKPICTERGVVKNSAEDFQDSDWTRKDLLGPNHRRKLKDTVLAFAKRGWI